MAGVTIEIVSEHNLRAMLFYEKHGFIRNSARDEDDVYFLRWPDPT